MTFFLSYFIRNKKKKEAFYLLSFFKLKNKKIN